jgi:hypothetical protein
MAWPWACFVERQELVVSGSGGMLQILNYYGQFQGMKGRLTAFPPLAQLLIAIVAIPGLLLALLSLLALVVSILALLLMTVPVYRLLAAITGSGKPTREVFVGEEVELIDPVVEASPSQPRPGSSGPNVRRPIEVKIID